MSNPRLAGGHRRPPLPRRIATATRGAVSATLRILLRDPLTGGLLLASVALLVPFFVMLGSLNMHEGHPARGTE